MTLKIISFIACDIDDSWYILGQNRRLVRETWDPNMVAIIQAKDDGASITVDTKGEVGQLLKFKNDALVTLRGNLLAFDASSLQKRG